MPDTVGIHRADKFILQHLLMIFLGDNVPRHFSASCASAAMFRTGNIENACPS